MTKDHRMFHRRAPQVATQVVTVAVEVVATVDTNGNVLGQETVLPQVPGLPTEVPVPALPVVSDLPLQSVVAQALPSDPAVVALAASVPVVPAVPTPAAPSLPQVPSVPPFPSDLKVPAVPSFPWPSGDPIAAAAAASANSAAATPAPTTEAAKSADPAASSTPVPEANSSAATSAALAVPSSLTSLESGSLSLSPTSLRSADQSSQVSSVLSRSSSAVPTADPAATNYYGPGGAPANPGATSSTVPAADSQASGAPAPLETPQVVGSVIGSLAGAALILAILLLLIRRHKRKRGGALQLTGDDRQPMSQAAGRNSLIPSGFLNRFSGMSRSTADTSTTGERSFQRVSGRKLPSAFSEGMTSDQFSRGGTMSGSSFYQDDQGTYGGVGFSKEIGKEIGDTSNYRGSGPMNFRPSPARTPVIRHPDDENPFSNKNRISHLSPPQSPNPDFPPRKGTLGRSLPSADGSRSSRFTENV
ncbi:hypothetical protein IQ07DRAFT_609401 [Pyrenochaeta sp. DS3sAY3a]|nr:hypothetical protein IQ07DRAFT_609401 [Pyrenochaeta sp. DS3sAY3a]